MSAVDVFEYAGQQVRTVVVDGEPWFMLGDVCAVLGIANARNVAGRLDDDERITVHLADGNRGNPNVTVVSEAGLFDVVIRSDSPKARPFRRWVTHDVLPTIRRTGRYGSDAEMLAALPSSQLLALAAEAAKRAEVAEAKIVEDAPKVLLADAVTASTDSILIRLLANLLKQNGYATGEKRLYQQLRDEGFLCRSGESWNRPTQRAMEMGLFEVIERPVLSGGDSPRIASTTKVTGKGQMYFVNRYCRALPAEMST